MYLLLWLLGRRKPLTVLPVNLSLCLDEEEGEEEEREYLASPMSGEDRECQLLLKLRMRSHAQPIRAFSNPLLLL